MNLTQQRRIPKRDISGILLFDKPAGLSSNTALQQVKRIYQADKAGHTGSLDPLATGLLPVCLGQATKLSGYLLDSDKRYRVRAKVGQRTDTGDADGKIIETSDLSGFSRLALEAVMPRFTDEIRQRPPMYSALKHQGRRLYKLARAGQEVERAERAVFIHELRLADFGDGFFELEVRCSKGTYIRTLVEDLAAAAGQCAHVTVLRRLEVAPFLVPRMIALDELDAAATQGLPALDALLLPMIAALSGWTQLRVDEVRAGYLAQGQAVRVAAAPRDGLVAVLDANGDLLGIAEIDPDGLVAPKRWMASISP